MNYQQPHATLIEKLYSMGVREQSKFSLREILNCQDPDPVSVKYLLAFHKGFTELLDQKVLPWECRTNDRGLTYYCPKKAFIMLSINKSFISILFFTGHQQIEGLVKGNWENGKDNLGCKRFRVLDDHSLRQAIKFGLELYHIAENWLD